MQDQTTIIINPWSKGSVLIVSSLLCCSVVVWLLVTVSVGRFHTDAVLTCAGFLTSTLVTCTWMALDRPITKQGICFMSCCYGLSVIALDTTFSGMNGFSALPLFLVLIALHLVVDQRPSRILLMELVLWIVITAIQDTVDFGLYRGMPCGVRSPLESIIRACIDLSGYLAVCYASTGAVHAVKVKEASRRQSVRDVVTALSSYDLNQAALVLSSPTFPEDLHNCLLGLLGNMEEYEAYLPEALFTAENGNSPHSRSPRNRTPPGRREGQATIVFTDIVGSTQMWESTPEAMKKALKKHNEIIRLQQAKYGGYEVKTIGDAFMVAYDCVYGAMGFGIDVQKMFSLAVWSGDLLSPLTVRIGIYEGPVEVEYSFVTGRYDYIGRSVNKAARIEACCMDGCVAVPSDLIPDLQSDVATASLIKEATILPMGFIMLKGVGNMHISLVAPQERNLSEKDVKFHLESKKNTGKTEAEDNKDVRRVDNKPLKGVGKEASFNEVPSATIGNILMCVPAAFNNATVINSCLQVVTQLLARCGAYVASFQGMQIIAGWNTNRKCIAHLEHAFRFVALITSSVIENTAISVGIACGKVCVGNFTGSAHAFISIFGSPVTVSGYLSEAAMILETYSLHAAVPGSSCSAMHAPSMRFRVRPVDTWTMETDVDMQVFEVKCTGPDMMSIHGLEPQSPDEVWGWSEAYRTAFEEKNHSLILLKANGDTVLTRVAVMLRDNVHLRQPAMGWHHPAILDRLLSVKLDSVTTL
eukprot:TRINITY_DN17389_c0_g1_i1.p1 TRINITY_DN17389_c0_g1~~TRINITY_DN17389_c0_g1_i1.p1  ORF type:complete len:763 (+),score=126.51 TRINITY_DN17389_c0_g1_i1:24-2291(+)